MCADWYYSRFWPYIFDKSATYIVTTETRPNFSLIPEETTNYSGFSVTINA